MMIAALAMTAAMQAQTKFHDVYANERSLHALTLSRDDNKGRSR